jgi:hypothetical protein
MVFIVLKLILNLTLGLGHELVLELVLECDKPIFLCRSENSVCIIRPLQATVYKLTYYPFY